MRYVTTNVRLPVDLWKALKMEAAHQGKRLAEVIREGLARALTMKRGVRRPKTKRLCGIWKGVNIPDSLIEEAKRSLFPPPEKFFS